MSKYLLNHHPTPLSIYLKWLGPGLTPAMKGVDCTALVLTASQTTFKVKKKGRFSP